MRLPSRGEAQVVIVVVIPIVVDIETLGIEVANVDAVAIRVKKICLLSSRDTESRGLLPALLIKRAGLYPFLSVFYSGATPFLAGIPPLRASKKFHLILYPLATILREV
jgi:hypothetical protein